MPSTLGWARVGPCPSVGYPLPSLVVRARARGPGTGPHAKGMEAEDNGRQAVRPAADS